MECPILSVGFGVGGGRTSSSWKQRGLRTQGQSDLVGRAVPEACCMRRRWPLWPAWCQKQVPGLGVSLPEAELRECTWRGHWACHREAGVGSRLPGKWKSAFSVSLFQGSGQPSLGSRDHAGQQEGEDAPPRRQEGSRRLAHQARGWDTQGLFLAGLLSSSASQAPLGWKKRCLQGPSHRQVCQSAAAAARGYRSSGDSGPRGKGRLQLPTAPVTPSEPLGKVPIHPPQEVPGTCPHGRPRALSQPTPHGPHAHPSVSLGPCMCWQRTSPCWVVSSLEWPRPSAAF